jgi:hypothetical protein
VVLRPGLGTHREALCLPSPASKVTPNRAVLRVQHIGVPAMVHRHAYRFVVGSVAQAYPQSNTLQTLAMKPRAFGVLASILVGGLTCTCCKHRGQLATGTYWSQSRAKPRQLFTREPLTLVAKSSS